MDTAQHVEFMGTRRSDGTSTRDAVVAGSSLGVAFGFKHDSNESVDYGFSITPSEAREFAAALLEAADQSEALTARMTA